MGYGKRLLEKQFLLFYVLNCLYLINRIENNKNIIIFNKFMTQNHPSILAPSLNKNPIQFESSTQPYCRQLVLTGFQEFIRHQKKMRTQQFIFPIKQELQKYRYIALQKYQDRRERVNDLKKFVNYQAQQFISGLYSLQNLNSKQRIKANYNPIFSYIDKSKKFNKFRLHCRQIGCGHTLCSSYLAYCYNEQGNVFQLEFYQNVHIHVDRFIPNPKKFLKITRALYHKYLKKQILKEREHRMRERDVGEGGVKEEGNGDTEEKEKPGVKDEKDRIYEFEDQIEGKSQEEIR